jgi:imidazolonepropionase-like amidohydrolase
MKELFIRARMIEDDDERDLVIADGVIADADPVPGTEPDAAGWVLPGLADVHNHLSLASPAGDDESADVRVRASASVELALGVLAIREPGSPDDASTRLAARTGGRGSSRPAGSWPRPVVTSRAWRAR